MIIDPTKFKKKQRTQAELEKMLKPYKGLNQNNCVDAFLFRKERLPLL